MVSSLLCQLNYWTKPIPAFDTAKYKTTTRLRFKTGHSHTGEIMHGEIRVTVKPDVRLRPTLQYCIATLQFW